MRLELTHQNLMRIFLILGAFMALLFVVACGGIEPGRQSIPENQAAQWTRLGDRIGDYGIFRYIDTEAGVACWVYGGGEGAGISCLPLGETNLQ